MEQLRSIISYIREIPDFPNPGVNFYDLTTLMKSPEGFRLSVTALSDHVKPYDIDIVAGIEARGFVFGSVIASLLGVGFIPIRKKGKLPGKTASLSYSMEYGEASIEVHSDAIEPNVRVALIDDLLATGGTAGAACQLIESLKGKIVVAGFVVELLSLKGRHKFTNIPVESLIQYGE